MSVFEKNSKIGDYTVLFPIKIGSYAETYRVRDSVGKLYFLKLINYAKLNRSQFDEKGNMIELMVAKKATHANLCKYHESGDFLMNNQKMTFLVFDYIVGETIAERIAREQMFNVFDAKQLISGVLNGVKFLHNSSNPIIHNELTIQNIMLDLSGVIPVAKIIDFGYARFINQGHKAFQKEGLNPFYMAPEAFNGIFTPQTDIYSIGVMLYHLLFGLPPYFVDLSHHQSDGLDIEDRLDRERQKPLKILDSGKFELDERLVNIIAKAVAYNVDDRFKTADDFIGALNGECEVVQSDLNATKVATKERNSSGGRRNGNGFADVAGMASFKAQLCSDVIDLLNNPEQAKDLGLSLPNGLLFYGPPGCGKTYFAEKFAEEIGCNYQYIKCSDVASPYIHGGQGKIAAIFDEARKNAPTVLFFDEIDAMVQDRSRHTNVSESGEVNEFLSQLNNCGEDGVIVIGATNKPSNIDKAALRSGRLELKYYIPQPDFETRKMLFQIHLKKRKMDIGIDYDKLAVTTTNYVSADIKLVVDTAARLVFRRKLGKITMDILEESIINIKPSVSLDVIKMHEAIRDEFECNKYKVERKKIGFA